MIESGYDEVDGLPQEHWLPQDDDMLMVFSTIGETSVAPFTNMV